MKRWTMVLVLLLLLTSCQSQATPKESSTEAPATETESQLAVGNKIGNLLPELRFKGLDGKEHSTADYKGKPLLVVFWTST